MQSNECPICCEKFNKRRIEISCLQCNKKCCSTCFGTRLLSSDPSCMHCHYVIPEDFVSTNMTKTFCDSYRDHNYEIHFIREKSLLPDTQEGAEREKKAREFEKEVQVINSSVILIKNEIRCITDELVILSDQIKNCSDKSLKRELKEKKQEKKTRKKILHTRVHDLHNSFHFMSTKIDILRQKVQPEKEKKYTRPCPDSECRGFLSSAYKCGTCEKYFCSDCHVLKNNRDDKDHICDEGVKASVKMINLDSKPCPKCSSYIYRIEGCSLMWCVKCHTQFDWNSLEIKHGHNHNPEYFRYLRETGTDIPRNPYEVAFNCDRIPTPYDLSRRLPHNIKDVLWQDIYRHRLHIIDVVMRRLPYRVEVLDCSELRIGYLLSDFDEKEWKKKYFRKMKKNEINHERYKVLDMYCNVIKDNFLNLMTDASTEGFKNFKDSCERIEKYADEQLLRINEKYKSKCKLYLKIKNMS